MLVDSNTSSGGVTFASTFTATQLYVNGAGLAAATTLYFQTLSTFTFTSLSLNGTAANRVALRSNNAGSYTYFNAISTLNVVGVNVADNNASPGSPIYADTNADAGHNVNWSFGFCSPPRSRRVPQRPSP